MDVYSLRFAKLSSKPNHFFYLQKNFLCLERQRVGGGRVCHGSTVNRKSRAVKVLSTRLLYKHPALLDDMCPVLADKVLSSVHRWQFNAFQLDRLTSGHCLPTICLHIFYQTGNKMPSHTLFQHKKCNCLSFSILLYKNIG